MECTAFPQGLVAEFGGIQALITIIRVFIDDASLLALAARCICALAIHGMTER
jgi:hypothetical protein